MFKLFYFYFFKLIKTTLNIFLQYGFVTPVTSLLVTIPDVEGRNVSLITSPLTIGEEVGENLNDQEMTNNHKSGIFFFTLPYSLYQKRLIKT